MFKDKKSPPSRLCNGAILFVLACTACLGIGFLTGKLYVENSVIASQALLGPSAQQALVASSTGTAITPLPQNPNRKQSEAVAVESASRVAASKGSLTVISSRKEGPSGSKLVQPVAPVCLNTCHKARDGVCDDGRSKSPVQFIPGAPGPVSTVLCDLGTDCDDCGPWQPSGPVPWLDDPKVGPVAILREKGVDMRVRRTSTTPGFAFAYTDPDKDFDVSGSMHNGGAVELGISKVFYKIFKDRCNVKGKNGKTPLFLDVGSNFGWFAVMAGVMGCRVVAFEPVPHFHAFLEYSVHLNGLLPLVDMRSNVVSHESGKTMEMVIPTRGIWGTAGIGGLNVDTSIPQSSFDKLHVMSYKLDDMVKEDVLLIKVDVEGWEWSVFQGAKELFKKYTVENVIMEYSPGVPERNGRHDDLISTVGMLQDLHRYGMNIAHIGNAGKARAAEWETPLTPFSEVTPKNLEYDMEDARRFKEGKLGCPMPQDMRKRFPSWELCNAVPEDVNPRSLRSEISHNTNIWATRNFGLMTLEGKVGLIDLNAPKNTFYTQDPAFGIGVRMCKDIPPKVQLRHRCRCSDASVCGDEAQALEDFLKLQELPSNYVLP